jgi:excisionase family DNA binding protein
MEAPSLWTMKQAAKFLGVSERTVRDHVRFGDLPYIAVGRGLSRPRKMFDPGDVRRFADSRRRITPQLQPPLSRLDPTVKARHKRAVKLADPKGAPTPATRKRARPWRPANDA